jgi:hypothetical protein
MKFPSAYSTLWLTPHYCPSQARLNESLDAFRQTRNARGALYCVAGKEAGMLAWNACVNEGNAS